LYAQLAVDVVSKKSVAELLLEAGSNVVNGGHVILPALAFDFDGAHQRGESTDGHPIHAARQAEQHASAEGITTASGINRPVSLDDRDVVTSFCGEDFSALLATRDNKR
jgi:hypothetical protein